MGGSVEQWLCCVQVTADRRYRDSLYTFSEVLFEVTGMLLFEIFIMFRILKFIDRCLTKKLTRRMPSLILKHKTSVEKKKSTCVACVYMLGGRNFRRMRALVYLYARIYVRVLPNASLSVRVWCWHGICILSSDSL